MSGVNNGSLSALDRSRVRAQLYLDPDSQIAIDRRYQDYLADFFSDLGGEQNCSTAQRALVRHVSQLLVQSDIMESRWSCSSGAAPNDRVLARYQKISETVRRLLKELGLKRTARDVTPPKLTEYLDQRRSKSSSNNGGGDG